MPRRLALALTIVLAACSGKEKQPAPPSAADVLADAAKTKALPDEHYVSPTEKFEITLPGAWKGHYQAIEKKDNTAGARLAVDFRFKPDSGSKAPSITAVVVRIYPKKVFDAAIAKGTPPPGAKFGEVGNDVFTVALPAGNPYPPASPEAPVYDLLIISMSQGGQHIHVAAKP